MSQNKAEKFNNNKKTKKIFYTSFVSGLFHSVAQKQTPSSHHQKYTLWLGNVSKSKHFENKRATQTTNNKQTVFVIYVR